jgi:hypothetical protein
VRRIVGREHHLDEQQLAVGLHRGPAVAQDRDALGLCPIMDDVREKIEVRAMRNPLKETARFDRDTAIEASRANNRRRLSDNMLKVKKDAPRSGMGG